MDEEFMRQLQEVTGNAWEGFDASEWRDVVAEEEKEAAAAAAAAAAAQLEASSQYLGQAAPARVISRPASDDGYDSEGSADIILSARHLTLEESESQGLGPRNYKLNKALGMVAEQEVLRDATNLEKVDWKEVGLHMGEISPYNEVFCPWRMVAHYTEMFVGKRNGERAAPLFTLEALHTNRVWDLYYLHHPTDIKKKPLIFVPTYQFEHLLAVVNHKLDINLTIPPGKNAQKFNMTFGIGSAPRPRFLGRSTTVDEFNVLTKGVPSPEPGDLAEDATMLGREEYLATIANIFSVQKKDKKSDKNRAQRIANHRAWGRALKRVQRYLGMREKIGALPINAGDDSDQAKAASSAQRIVASEPEGSVLFVAIDIEAYEHNHSMVTEVGVAILDTDDIRRVPSQEGKDVKIGAAVKEWFPIIQARHIRVKENAWALNSTHVQGCADRFDFGKSEFIPLREVAPTLREIIDGATHSGDDGGNASETNGHEGEAASKKDRPVVLVFHDSASDIQYLSMVGYDVNKAPNVIDIVDTRELYQYLLRAQNPTRLSSVLDHLEIDHRFLHNAANDAMYTMRAMVGIAIKKRLDDLKKAAEKKHDDGHIPYAEFKTSGEGWTSGGEDDDGGNAPYMSKLHQEPVAPVDSSDSHSHDHSSTEW